MLSINVFLAVNKATLFNADAHRRINFTKCFLTVLHSTNDGRQKAEHLLSFALLHKARPTHPPTDKTQRGSGELSQTHNAELMGVDGGGVTVSASVSVQLSAAVGQF